MPRLISSAHRETVDLHAPWWSDATDETGRYLERAVIYAEMTEGDQQAINAKINGQINFNRQGQRLNPKTLAQVRVFTLKALLVELTDDTGAPLPLTEQALALLPSRDVEWIDAELDRRNRAPVEPTEADESEAEAALAKAEAEAAARGAEVISDPARHTAAGVAERHFRKGRQ